MNLVIDVSSDCGLRAAHLKAAGVRTVIRYYSRDTGIPAKRLSHAEALALTAAGLRLGIVHEARHGDKVSSFDAALGLLDGVYAHKYGTDVIGQPAGSTIYFGVDFDATAAEITARILPYFQSVSAAFAHQGGPAYQIGVYGSGATCKAVLAAGFADRSWLAQSTGWTGFSAYKTSGAWSLLQGKETAIANVPCDTDEVGSTGMGDFTLVTGIQANPVASLALGAATLFVNARNGLHLRAGPGVEFNIKDLLPNGTPVQLIATSGNWTLVDLRGDGASDGYVSSGYLSSVAPAPAPIPATSPATLVPAPLSTPDAVHIADLIHQGSTAAGLKAARETAKKAYPNYPHDGCAAHLSALLQHANINVAMELGAGKLAHIITKRGWVKVAPGSQRAGDVGVCFDNDPTPPGADHIYLVLETHGPDEMLIADNQRTEDAPHLRFASGKGKTATEYFLRA